MTALLISDPSETSLGDEESSEEESEESSGDSSGRESDVSSASGASDQHGKIGKKDFNEEKLVNNISYLLKYTFFIVFLRIK